MPENWNATGDFDQVVDGLEAITLHRRGAGAPAIDLKALRQSTTSSEAEASNGAVIQSDVVWEYASGSEGPARIGDLVIDSLGRKNAVLVVETLALGARSRITTRSLAIEYELGIVVAIEEAVWGDSGGTPVVTAWRTLRPAEPARIQPVETTVDASASPSRSSKKYRVFLLSETPLDHNHRIVGADGVVYQVDRFLQAERIDALAIAEVSVADPEAE